MGIRTVQAVTTRSNCGEIDRYETHIVSLYHLGDAERPTWATRESVALGTMSRNRNAKQAPGRESQSPPRHKRLQTSKAPLVLTNYQRRPVGACVWSLHFICEAYTCTHTKYTKIHVLKKLYYTTNTDKADADGEINK